MKTLKSNKLVLTVLIALIVALINYLCYPIIIDNMYKKVKVPMVSQRIEEYSLVDEDDIVYQEVYEKYLSSDVIRDASSILGNYVSAGFTLTEGMFFYQTAISSESEIMTEVGSNLIDDSYLFSIKLDEISSTNGAINQGQFVDVYFIGKDNRNGSLVVSGLLVNHVLVKKTISNNDNYVNYAVIVLNEQEFDYCLRAREIGELLLVVSNSSLLAVKKPSAYYSVAQLRAFIDEYSLSFSRSVDNDSTQ